MTTPGGPKGLPMKFLKGHIQDAGHGAHPGFENCDDESHYEIVEEWSVVRKCSECHREMREDAPSGPGGSDICGLCEYEMFREWSSE